MASDHRAGSHAPDSTTPSMHCRSGPQPVQRVHLGIHAETETIIFQHFGSHQISGVKLAETLCTRQQSVGRGSEPLARPGICEMLPEHQSVYWARLNNKGIFVKC
jgi:hypothetical protein